MPNYQQTSVAGDCWVRASKVEIDNPYGDEYSSIRFLEEKIWNFSNGTILKEPVRVDRPESAVYDYFSAETINTTFPILDENGAETGVSYTYNDVYKILHSLYVFLANKRDISYASALEKERIKNEEYEALLRLQEEINAAQQLEQSAENTEPPANTQ